MKADLCKCGKKPHVWKTHNAYICGCINPKCQASFAGSFKSKDDAIERWNEAMKRIKGEK